MKLQDLSLLGQRLKSEYEIKFRDDDIRLPQAFTEIMNQFDSSPVTYKTYNFIVHSTSGLKIYYPNQVIYIAAYFTEYFDELEKYRNYVVSIGGLSSDEIKNCRGNKTVAHEIVFSNRFQSVEEEDKELLEKFLYDYQWWHGGKTIDRGDYYVSPILALADLVNASHGFVADICRILAQNVNALNALKEVMNGHIDSYYQKAFIPSSCVSKQIIYFGAPGTGKSYKVEKEGSEYDRIRTTFHPDTDYSSFVGCYKPMQDEDDPKKIVYKFEGQCFAKAYVEAWKRFVAREEGENINYTLVIEEINRGNCAQIFGDIFQLLDRNEDGFSQYGIQPDEDLTSYLRGEFERLEIKDSLNEHGYAKIAEGIEMKLPPNLSIIATMNTSDQSLFPIDSAFKRRWDWEYIPIQYEPVNEDGNKISNKIDIDGTLYDWGDFIEAVNAKIYALTKSEDKELGYFFVRPAKGENISTQRFVSKVIFYLWSDIYKDYVGRDNSIFKFSEDGDEKNRKDHSFNSFFDNGKIKTKLVIAFIEQFEKVKKSAISIDDSKDDVNSSGKRYQYSINGEGQFAGKDLALEAMKLYVKNNPDKTPQEIVDEWNTLGLNDVLVNKQTFVATTQFYRSKQVPCNSGSVWVTTYGWTYNKTASCPTPTIPILMEAVKKWNINMAIINK